jgi:hypothetical protein
MIDEKALRYLLWGSDISSNVLRGGRQTIAAAIDGEKDGAVVRWK